MVKSGKGGGENLKSCFFGDLQLPMQSIPITTNVTSSNLAQAIQHYVIKFASDLWQVRGFLCALRFTPNIYFIWYHPNKEFVKF
jgi:hypothetical protein